MKRLIDCLKIHAIGSEEVAFAYESRGRGSVLRQVFVDTLVYTAIYRLDEGAAAKQAAEKVSAELAMIEGFFAEFVEKLNSCQAQHVHGHVVSCFPTTATSLGPWLVAEEGS